MLALNNGRFGYEDAGGSGTPIVAVHGASDHGGPIDLVADLAALIEALDLAPALLIGHSLGGVTAYRLAARRPELVRAMVIEDVGAVTDETELDHPVLDITDWPLLFDLDELMEIQRATQATGGPTGWPRPTALCC